MAPGTPSGDWTPPAEAAVGSVVLPGSGPRLGKSLILYATVSR